MTAANLPFLGFPEERPDHSRYFTKVLAAAPPYWHAYNINPTTGVADGILAVAAALIRPSLSIRARRRSFSPSWWSTAHTPIVCPTASCCGCKHAATTCACSPTMNRMSVRLAGQIPCADGPRLPSVVRSFFADAARLLKDEWFLIAVDSAK